MTSLKRYAHAAAFEEDFLQVSNIHKLHYEQYGNKNGKPVVFLHGGPGGSASYEHTIFFDPEVYRVVLFDQRGAGRSLPPAELRENTSQDLVADIEVLRRHLGIGKWFMVFGGSWGSTLALLYAEMHPESVGSIILRGVFNERKSELRFSRGPWEGAARVFPEQYNAFLSYLPPEDRENPVMGYYKLVTSEDCDTRLNAAKAWNRWDLSISKLILPKGDQVEGRDETWLLQHARLETHYAVNGGFMEDGQLLKPESLAKIKHIPCSIVNGRYDMLCPPLTAWEIHNGLPQSRLYIIEDAGHSMMEPGILQKLIELCDEYGKMGRDA